MAKQLRTRSSAYFVSFFKIFHFQYYRSALLSTRIFMSTEAFCILWSDAGEGAHLPQRVRLRFRKEGCFGGCPFQRFHSQEAQGHPERRAEGTRARVSCQERFFKLYAVRSSLGSFKLFVAVC